MIVDETGAGHRTRVFYIAADGTETEISDSVHEAWVKIKVGEPNEVHLGAYMIGGAIKGALGQIDVAEIDVIKHKKK